MKTFSEFQEAALAIPAAAGVISKVLPAAVATYGAVKTIKDTLPTFMQIKKRVPKDKSKTADIAREKDLDLTDPRQRRKAASLANKRNKTNKTNKKINPKTGDFVKPRYDTKLQNIRVEPKKGEIEASEKIVGKINNPTFLEKIRRNIRKEEVTIANSLAGGKIAGTVEAGDDPPKKKNKRGSGVKNRKKKKKKTYAYGGRGSRKMWMA